MTTSSGRTAKARADPRTWLRLLPNQTRKPSGSNGQTETAVEPSMFSYSSTSSSSTFYDPEEAPLQEPVMEIEVNITIKQKVNPNTQSPCIHADEIAGPSGVKGTN